MSEDVRFARVINAQPDVVFDEFTSQEGQEIFYSEPGWSIQSECDLRVGGLWTVTFWNSGDEVFRHDHIFRVIDRPSRLVIDTTESRPDGSVVKFEIEYTFEAREDKTLMTMIQRGLPTAELRDEHLGGVAEAFERLEQLIARTNGSPDNSLGDGSKA